MSIFLYLINRIFYNIFQFLRHWYVDSFRRYVYFVVSALESLDRGLAFKITFTHLFQPLYQDRSFIGYVLGFFFRIGRLIFAGIIYLFFIILAILIYLAWLLLPVYILYRILINGQPKFTAIF